MIRPLLTACCLAIVSTAALVAPPAAASRTAQPIAPAQPTVAGHVVVGDGHLDIGPRLRDGRWQVAIHDDRAGTPVWRRPSDVVIRVHDAAALTAPRSAPYAFLGEARGRQVYVIPQTQRRGVVWTGWNTRDPAVRDAVALGATFTFRGLRGPGAVHVFLQSGTGGPPELLWSSARRTPQPLFVEANTHTHANWVFTRPGSYQVELEISATLRSGRKVSDRQSLRFAVGDGTPASFAATPTRPRDSSPASVTAPVSAAGAAAGSSDSADRTSGSVTWLLAGAVSAAVIAGAAIVALQGRSRRRRAALLTGGERG